MDATLALPLLVGLIGVALLFDFLNGLHDAANSIATIVSTRVLRPRYAVMWAAFFNFIAFLFFGTHVAQTIGKGIVLADVVTPAVVFGASGSSDFCVSARDTRTTPRAKSTSDQSRATSSDVRMPVQNANCTRLRPCPSSAARMADCSTRSKGSMSSSSFGPSTFR